MTARQFRQRVGQISDHLELDEPMMHVKQRWLLWVARRKVEILRLLLLQLNAILDETDSSLDVDALRCLKGIQAYRGTCGGSLRIITHSTPHSWALEIDRTHVMVGVTWWQMVLLTSSTRLTTSRRFEPDGEAVLASEREERSEVMT